jgi:glyoxylase I family protein
MQMANQNPPVLAGIHHLALSVTDLDRAIVFYCEVLGATIVRPPFRSTRDSFSGRMAIVALGPLLLDLMQHDANKGAPFSPARSGLDHVGLRAASRNDLDSWAAWLDAHGVARSEIRDGGGVGWIFDFVDPDGIQLEFFFLDREILGASQASPVVKRPSTTE